MKKAILIVSVGTSRVEALENTTLRFQKDVMEQFPEYGCYVAFSSRHILNKMNANSEQTYMGLAEAFEKMLSDGVEEVIIQSTNLLNGLESDSMLEQIECYKMKFKEIRTGRPLLNVKEDYISTLQVILEYVSLREEEALVLVGHGSNYLSGSTYQNLEYTAYTTGHRNVFVGTVEDSKSQTMTLRKLGVSGFKKVRLMPLLFVAGYHALKDVASDGHSWKSVLEEAGYEVEPTLVGLGEIPGIRQIFVKHLKATME